MDLSVFSSFSYHERLASFCITKFSREKDNITLRTILYVQSVAAFHLFLIQNFHFQKFSKNHTMSDEVEKKLFGKLVDNVRLSSDENALGKVLEILHREKEISSVFKHINSEALT